MTATSAAAALAHSNMPDAIAADPLYRAAVEASGGWSIMVGLKRMDLFLILTRFLGRLEHHNIIEFGSYRGGNALFMAWILRELHPEAKGLCVRHLRRHARRPT
jgi:hypothetical protein